MYQNETNVRGQKDHFVRGWKYIWQMHRVAWESRRIDILHCYPEPKDQWHSVTAKSADRILNGVAFLVRPHYQIFKLWYHRVNWGFCYLEERERMVRQCWCVVLVVLHDDGTPMTKSSPRPFHRNGSRFALIESSIYLRLGVVSMTGILEQPCIKSLRHLLSRVCTTSFVTSSGWESRVKASLFMDNGTRTMSLTTR